MPQVLRGLHHVDWMVRDENLVLLREFCCAEREHEVLRNFEARRPPPFSTRILG